MIESVVTFLLGVLAATGWHKRGTVEWWVRFWYHKARGHHR